MTQRERFLACMGFRTVDRIPVMEVGIWEETFERWHHEGLPKWVTCLQHLEDYLQMDRSWNLNWLPIHEGIFPAFERRVLEDSAEEEVVIDEHGVTCRQRKCNRTIPQYLRFPVETMADYERLLPRLDGADPGRYAEDFDEDLQCRRGRGEIVGLSFPAFFGFPRDLMGMENWCAAFYEQPELVRRIISDRVRFFKDVYARVLATGALDFVQVWEDMAYKTASLLSPALVRRFMLPAYEEIVASMRAGGVKLIMVDCDGCVRELLPIWLEAGIDGTHPCEIAAGSDPFLLRRACPRVPLSGGMDKRVLSQGREAVDAELTRVMPLVKEGGYLPMLDHFVPPDMPWDTYRYYVERRKEVSS
jgi:uroporphyrinogen decarboxylase